MKTQLFEEDTVYLNANISPFCSFLAMALYVYSVLKLTSALLALHFISMNMKYALRNILY